MARLYRSRSDEADLRRWCTDRLRAWSFPHSTTTIHTNLGPTHLTSLGDGADVCVYLPGTNFNAATSTPLLEALGRHCRVVCADLPGQPGLSAADRSRQDVASLSGWVGRVLLEARERHPAGRLVLVGHSRGAAVALCAVPDTVESLLLISPAGLVPAHLTVDTLTRSVAWLLRPSPRSSSRLVTLMTGSADASSPDTDLAEMVDWMTMVARTTRTAGAPHPHTDETLRRWRGHNVRIIVGEDDVFFPPERLASAARRHLDQPIDVIPGAGHLLTSAWTHHVAAAVASAFQ